MRNCSSRTCLPASRKRSGENMPEPHDNSRSSRFNPPDVSRHDTGTVGLGDQRSGALYIYNDKISLAVRVALATGRPLLLRGAPGWGKSSLAHAAANDLGYRYLEKVISSRTQA